MTDTWQAFMDAQTTKETAPPAASSNLVDLSALGAVFVTGADAATFLQGQFTNDVGLSTHERAQLSAWCSPKGRVLLSFWLFGHADGFCLLTPTALDEKLIARLRLFVLRSNVKIAQTNDSNIRIGCSGVNAERCLLKLYEQIPASAGEVVQHADGVTVLRTLGELPRFELLGGVEEMQKIWTSVQECCGVASPTVWARQDIEAGLPLVEAQMADQYLPQMLNLQALEAINFDKGCYVGQEVIARLHYRGNVKRQLYLATCAAGAGATAGTEVVSTARGQPHAAGKVLAAQPGIHGDQVVQAVLNIADAEEAALELPDGAKLTLSEPLHAAEDA